MKGFVNNIQKLTKDNKDFRRVLYTYTGKHLQLVLMTLKPGEEIGEEIHVGRDQFFRVEKGKGEVVIDGHRRQDQERRCNPGAGRSPSQRDQQRRQTIKALHGLWSAEP